MSRVRILAAAIFFFSILTGSANAWTRSDMLKCTAPNSAEPCPLPAQIRAMVLQCDAGPPTADVSIQNMEVSSAITCEDFVLAEGRFPTLGELKARMLEKRRVLKAIIALPDSQKTETVIRGVRVLLTKDLRDPDSAMFRNERVIEWNNKTYVCGEMNAKNGYGGYAGYSSYMISPADSDIDIGIALALGKYGATPQCSPSDK